jgi:hypothetical protein
MAREHLGQSKEISATLHEVMKNLVAMPQGLQHEAVLMLNHLGENSLLAWSNMSVELAKDVRTDYEHLLGQFENRALALEKLTNTVTQELARATDLTNKALHSFDELPLSLESKADATLADLSSKSIAFWEQSANEFRAQLFKEYEMLIEKVGEHVQEAAHVIKSLSGELNQVASTARTNMEKFDKLPDDLKSRLDATFGKLGDDSLNAWKAASVTFGTDLETRYFTYVDNVESAAQQIANSITVMKEGMAQGLLDYDALINRSLKQIVVDARAELEGSLQPARDLLMTALPHLSQNVQNFTEGLGDLLGKVKVIQHEHKIWLQQIADTKERLCEIQHWLTQAHNDAQRHWSAENTQVAELLKVSLNQLEAANKTLGAIHRFIPGSNNGIRADLQDSLKLLAQIKAGIDRFIDKKSTLEKLGSLFSKRQDNKEN